MRSLWPPILEVHLEGSHRIPSAVERHCAFDDPVDSA
jgi:hypothetical protein